jgi:uncharacterized protein YukE
MTKEKKEEETKVEEGLNPDGETDDFEVKAIEVSDEIKEQLKDSETLKAIMESSKGSVDAIKLALKAKTVKKMKEAIGQILSMIEDGSYAYEYCSKTLEEEKEEIKEEETKEEETKEETQTEEKVEKTEDKTNEAIDVLSKQIAELSKKISSIDKKMKEVAKDTVKEIMDDMPDLEEIKKALSDKDEEQEKPLDSKTRLRKALEAKYGKKEDNEDKSVMVSLFF